VHIPDAAYAGNQVFGKALGTAVGYRSFKRDLASVNLYLDVTGIEPAVVAKPAARILEYTFI
jgi:hypothetical protein